MQSFLPKTAEGVVGKGDERATRKNIPIVVREKESRALAGLSATSDRLYEHDWLDHPPACVISTEKASTATMTATFYSDHYVDSDDWWLVTAAHAAQTDDGEWGNPNLVDNPDSGDGDGDIVESYGNELGTSDRDYALLNPYYDRYQSYIRNTSDSDPDTDWGIGGAITDQELKNQNYGDYNKISQLKAQGCMTGRKGNLRVDGWDTGSSSRNDDQRVLLRGDFPVEPGDSGGPIFFIEEIGGTEQLVMCGLIQRENGQAVMGPSAESVEKGLNGFFA